MALALPLLLALLGTTPGLGAPGGACGVPPSAWCQNWMTALRCGALGRCPRLTQGSPDMDICAVCQQLVGLLHHISNQSTVEVVLNQVEGILCLHLPFVVTPCRTLVQALVHRLLYECQHLKPQQVCARVKLCHGEPGAAPTVPVLEVPDTHLQGSSEAGLSRETLPVPVPLCWMCRKLVERAE
ncbi:PSPB protein, partial [Myiagra hebetior]|nr:PSPB protein [Myiagra hebetior]